MLKTVFVQAADAQRDIVADAPKARQPRPGKLMNGARQEVLACTGLRPFCLGPPPGLFAAARTGAISQRTQDPDRGSEPAGTCGPRDQGPGAHHWRAGTPSGPGSPALAPRHAAINRLVDAFMLKANGECAAAGRCMSLEALPVRSSPRTPGCPPWRPDQIRTSRKVREPCLAQGHDPACVAQSRNSSVRTRASRPQWRASARRSPGFPDFRGGERRQAAEDREFSQPDCNAAGPAWRRAEQCSDTKAMSPRDMSPPSPLQRCGPGIFRIPGCDEEPFPPQATRRIPPWTAPA